MCQDGTTGQALYVWIKRNGYFSGNFKYNDINVNGILIIDIINELKHQTKLVARSEYTTAKEDFDSTSEFAEEKKMVLTNSGKKLS